VKLVEDGVREARQEQERGSDGQTFMVMAFCSAVVVKYTE
jgi:hypothetical protein